MSIKHLLIIVTLFCVITSCTKSATDPHATPEAQLNDTRGPVIQIDSMPLVVGHTWTYTKGISLAPDTFTVKVIADTIINGERAAVVSTYDGSNTSTAYYTNRDNGYYLLANRYTDSLVVLKTPVCVATFPITMNNSWSSVDSFIFVHPITFVSKWLDYDKVTTPAGAFNCCKFQYISDEYGIYTYNYYSTKGLVKSVGVEIESSTPGQGPHYYADEFTTLIAVNF